MAGLLIQQAGCGVHGLGLELPSPLPVGLGDGPVRSETLVGHDIDDNGLGVAFRRPPQFEPRLLSPGTGPVRRACDSASWRRRHREGRGKAA